MSQEITITHWKVSLFPPNERETFYTSRIAHVYEWPGVGKVIGFRNRRHFTIEYLRVQLPRQGGGTAILKWLKEQYASIDANWILPESAGFWLKMQDHGLIEDIVMEGGDLLTRQHSLGSEFTKNYEDVRQIT